MLERLGHVLGWAGNIVALVCLGLAVLFALNEGDTAFFLVFGGVLALVAFLVGQALRYIFAGGK